jgi:hypothetical protein
MTSGVVALAQLQWTVGRSEARRTYLNERMLIYFHPQEPIIPHKLYHDVSTGSSPPFLRTDNIT